MNRLRSRNALLGVAVLAGSSLLAVGSLQANTEDDVASEPTAQQTNPLNLNTGTTYTSGAAPVATSDLTFNATNFYSEATPTGYTQAAGVFAVSGTAFSIGSVDDLSTSQVITLGNGNSGTTGAIMLNGGDSVSGNPADLLYVASGATLNILAAKPNGTAGAGTVSLNPLVSGNFDVVGTSTISVPIAAGMLGSGGALAASASAITKTGAGTLVLTSATTNYTGGTTFAGGVLNVGSTAAIGTAGVLSFTGGTLQYSAANTTDYSARFSTAANQAYSVDTNGQAVTYATALTSSGGSLTKLGTGTLTLSAANTYTGTTAVSAGTLTVAAGGSLGAGAVTVASGGTLTTVAGASLGLGGNLGTGTSVTVAGTGILTLASSTSFSARQALSFSGASTITLNNTTNGPDTLLSITDSDNGSDPLTAGATYTAAQLDTAFGVNSFAGAGSLTVMTGGSAAVPEPSTWACVMTLVGMLGFMRGRRAGARLN